MTHTEYMREWRRRNGGIVSRKLALLVAFALSANGAEQAVKQDSFTHVMAKPPTSAGSAYDYDFTGRSVTGLSALGGATPEYTINVKASPYNATGDGVTDDTTAIQNALNALSAAGGGTLFFPKGDYLCNGAFDATTNSVLKIPFITGTTTPPVTIRMRGENPGSNPSWYLVSNNSSGSIIHSTKTGTGTAPALIAAGPYRGTGIITDFTQFNATNLYIDSLTFRTYDNPTINAVRMDSIANLVITDTLIDTGNGTITLPATHGTTGLWMPNSGNNAFSIVNRVFIGCYDTGLVVGEHTNIYWASIGAANHGIKILPGYHILTGNALVGVYNTSGRVLEWVGQAPVNLNIHYEYPPGSPPTGIYDPSNVGSGVVRYGLVSSGVGYTTDQITTNGGANLTLENLYMDKFTISSSGIINFNGGSSGIANFSTGYLEVNNGTKGIPGQLIAGAYDANFAGVTSGLLAHHKLSSGPGTATAGMGSGVLYVADDSGGTAQSIGETRMQWSDPTHATRTGNFNVALENNGGSTMATRFTVLGGSGGFTLNGTTPASGRFTISDGTSYKDSTWNLPTSIGTNSYVLTSNGTNATWAASSGGAGTVTDFSAGDLSPLFTTTEATTTTTPALSFVLTNAGATTVFGRAAGTSGAPTYSSSPQFTAIGNLTTNGFVKTGGGVGTLSVDTATYQPSDPDLTTWAGITPATGMGTWIATPSSANLRATVTDENGTGALLFSGATTPDFTTGFTIGGVAASGKIPIGNGTNYVPSTPAYPNAASTSGKHIKSDGTNFVTTTATLSDAPGTAGKVMVSDGTNWITSTPTFPNASATSGKVIKSDGTNWVASTETYPAPGTVGNVMVSDGTNWTSVSTIPQNAQNTAYTFVASDAGKHIFHDEVTARTYTIPANGTVAFPVGTSITIVNNTGGGTITLAITTDTLRRGDGTAGTGSRTITADSVATILKTKSTEWMITGKFN